MWSSTWHSAARKCSRLYLASALGIGAASVLVFSSPAASAAVGQPTFATSAALNSAAMTVAEKLTGLAAGLPEYAGDRITGAGVELDVVGSVNPAMQSAISASAGAARAALAQISGAPADGLVPIAARSVSRSLAELNGVTRQIDAAQASWAQRGIALSSWGPDIDSNTVLIHLVDYTLAARDALQAAYGAAISIAPQSQTAVASSRTLDSVPWYGGDSIHSGSTYCTSWFSAHSSMYGYVAPTAGHCGAGTWSNGSTVMGTVTGRHFGGTMDGELIGVDTSADEVWADPTTSTRIVSGVASSDPIGGHVCTDGATDREVCNVYIDSVNQSVSYDGQTITGTVFAWQLDDKPAFSAGDSGGPVYAAGGTTYCTAYGMVLARWTGDANQGWYMPARTVDSYFGVSILT